MSQNEQFIQVLKQSLEALKDTNAPQLKIDALQAQIDELEVQSLDLNSIPEIPFQEMHARPQREATLHATPISPVVSKLQSRPTEELIGMAKNRLKEIDPDGKLSSGEILEKMISDLQDAQKQKHEVVTAYADVFTQKTDADSAVRIATRNLYGFYANMIESGEIKLTERRKNDNGEELDSWVMPSWLPEGFDVLNDVELVYDHDSLFDFVITRQLWDVVSIDEDKLARWLKQQSKDSEGKQTRKYARPITAPVIELPKFKPTIGKAIDWTSED